MKFKLLTLIIMMALFCPVVFSYTEIQYSLDNNTWEYAENVSTNYVTLEELNNGVDSDTTYYFRLRHIYDNGTSAWFYVNTNTQEGINVVEFIGVAILMGIITIGLAYFATKIEYVPFKIGLGLLSGLMFIFSFRLGAEITETADTTATSIINIMDSGYGIAVYLFGFVFMIVIIYLLVLLFKQFTGWEKQKRSEREESLNEFR